eukprot:1172730-Amphidinium_carterae.1
MSSNLADTNANSVVASIYAATKPAKLSLTILGVSKTGNIELQNKAINHEVSMESTDKVSEDIAAIWAQAGQIVSTVKGGSCSFGWSLNCQVT